MQILPQNSNPVRTFIAVTLHDEVKLELSKLILDFNKISSFVKWVTSENVHFTLKFLGEIPAGSLSKVYSACKEAAVSMEPFACCCEDLGVFPSKNSPRVIWLGIKKGEQELKGLALKVEANLEKEGFPKEEREFQAHLTLGRIKKDSSKNNSVKNLWDELSPYHSFKLGEIPVDKICVMKSVLRPKGPEYSVLNEFKLGKIKVGE